MSAPGQKRLIPCFRVMSGMPLIAAAKDDIESRDAASAWSHQD